jgi:hypothetical protein
MFILGCTVELRSPIVFKRKPEEEKTPPPRVVALPAPSASTNAEGAQRETFRKVAIPEQPTVTPEIPEVERQIEPEDLSSPQYKTDAFFAKNIVILSNEYLENTNYEILGKITVKDVSQKGFSKKEAKAALQFEAFRQFGLQAKGITNIQYKGKTSFIPGSERFPEVSGDVITWE